MQSVLRLPTQQAVKVVGEIPSLHDANPHCGQYEEDIE